MSTEQTEPTTHYGDDGHGAGSAAANAQAGETSSSQAAGGPGSGRRRRRRRKNKGAGVAAQQPGGEFTELSTPAGAAPQSLPNGSSQNGAQAGPAHGAQNGAQVFAQNGSQNGHGGGKRKNGRKRNADGAQAASNAGQNGNAGGRNRQGRQNGAWKQRGSEGPDGNREGARGGFGTEPFQYAGNGDNGNGRRKGKFGRRAPASFVGPMDHSYRMVNGNVADGSPSTMDYRNSNANGNIGVSGRNEFGEQEPAAVLRENAPTRIICFIEDLFVVAKMQETARKLGVKVQFAKAEKETLAAITDGPEADRPSLIVFDLNNASAKPLTVIPKLKAKLKRATSIIGFLQHIQGDLKLKATEAGCDSVMPKAAFSQNLPNLLRRHGLAEEEEMIGA